MPDARAALLWAVAAVVLALLAQGLPQRTFVVGDPGLKLIAAKEAAAHPGRPFEVDRPRVGGRPVDFIDPSFVPHGDHLHAKTSELFPLLTAPLLALLGIGGVYILPALGFLLAVAATAWAGMMLDGRRSAAWLVFAAAAFTPWLFYGLEFWEHAPAVGAAALATALLVRRRSPGGLTLAGVLLGLSVALRPEAAWYCVALAAGSWWLPERPSLCDGGAVLAGLALAWMPVLACSYAHFGQALGGHVAGNMAGLSEAWLSDRISTFRLWLAPSHPAWAAACLLLLAGALLARVRPAATTAVRTAGAVFAAAAAVAAARGTFGAASLWNAAPATLLLLAPPGPARRRGGTFLGVVAAADALLVLLTAPNDGGGQWGPRYLLFAFIPVAILAADRVASAVGRRRVTAAIAMVVIAASSLAVQRSAYKNLRGAKQAYGRLLDVVERATSPGGYVVTDLWWLQQVTAALYPTRTVLFVDGSAPARRVLALLDGEPNVSVVRSERESSPEPLDAWLEGTGFAAGRRATSRERSLVVVSLIGGR